VNILNSIEKTRGKALNGLKCVVCGSSNVYSKLYKYTQNEKFKSIITIRGKRTFKLKIPTCKECYDKFYKWKIYDQISLSIFVLSLLSVFIGIIFLFFYQFIGDKGVLLIGFGFIFIIFSLTWRYILGKIKSNPYRYFYFDFLSKIFYVKPIGKRTWIPYKSWINDVLKK